MTEAVASGRIVRDSSPRSTKVYISFSTMSVVSPMERLKSSVFSRMGRTISRNPKFPNISRALPSTNCHFSDSPGRMSLNPRTAVMIFMAQRHPTAYFEAV